MDVTVKQLRAFVAVHRGGSFTRAAQALHLTQPALSSAIRNLEEQLGLALFVRGPGETALTAAGRELLPRFERILADLDHTLDSLSGRDGGRVLVGVLPSPAAVILPPILAAFRIRYPRIRVSVEDSFTDSQRLLEVLRVGELDCGMGIASPGDTDLSFTPMLIDRMAAIVPRTHPLARRRRVTWAQVAKLPVMMGPAHTGSRRLADQAFAAAGVSVEPVYEARLSTTMLGMARAGLGVALYPDIALRLSPTSDLVAIPLVDPVVHRSVGLIHRPVETLGTATRVFVRFAADWYAAHGPEGPQRRTPRASPAGRSVRQ